MIGVHLCGSKYETRCPLVKRLLPKGIFNSQKLRIAKSFRDLDSNICLVQNRFSRGFQRRNKYNSDCHNCYLLPFSCGFSLISVI